MILIEFEVWEGLDDVHGLGGEIDDGEEEVKDVTWTVVFT